VFSPARVYAATGQLAWILGVADLNGDGIPDIAVANYGGGSDGNGTVGILIGTGTGTFRPAVAYSTGGPGVTGIAIADLNGDRKPDLVLANQGCSQFNANCVGVLINNGNGTFQPSVTYPNVGYQWASGEGLYTPTFVQDINHDNHPDVIVVKQSSSTGDGVANVMLGNGDGTFRLAAGYDTGGMASFAAVFTDVNGDGQPDLLVLNCASTGATSCSTGNANVGVLLGKSDGTFQLVRKYSTGAAGGTSAIISADVNGDGIPDILVGNGCPGNCTGDGSFSVLLGKGDGTFQPAVVYDIGARTNVIGLAVADLTGDGIPDLAVGYGAISVWRGKGDGTFELLNSYPAGDSPLMLADLNGDGYLDIVGIAGTSNTASILLGNGDGTFHSGQTFPLGGSQFSWATLADVNKDGRLDLLAANWCAQPCPAEAGTVGVLLNTTAIHSPTTTTLRTSLNPSIYGQRVTLSAVVSSTLGTPTGTVVFTYTSNFGTYNIGNAVLDSNGLATITRSGLNADVYPITAVYKGDPNHLSSTSALLTQTVRQATSVASLTSSSNPLGSGQAVNFTARITSPTVTPTGAVTLFLAKTVLGSVQLAHGVAVFTTSSLPVGSDKITVTYMGDSNITNSSASVIQTVHP
jgi:hypothetical protein